MHRHLSRYASAYHARGTFARSIVSSVGMLLAMYASSLSAQGLAPKRVLTTGAAPGCEISLGGQGVVARRDNVEARRLAAAGQEAALIGDQTAARDAFAKAAVLNPGDERVAYDLARAHEELSDTSKAINEYCRYLTLSPSGREATDVRDRLVRLVARPAAQRARDVQVAFRLGLALFDDGRYDASARAFDDVVKFSPTASEGFFNRGLARAASGKRDDALKDMEQYRAVAPTVEDRVEVGRAIEKLRRPVYGAGVAFARGVLPGFAQFYTGRPVFGGIVLASVVGAATAAFVQQTTTRQIAYVDPNGVSAPYTQTTSARPYFTIGVASAGAITIAAAIEAMLYAQRSQQGASIVAPRGVRAATSPGDFGFAMTPLIDWRGRAGVRVSTRF